MDLLVKESLNEMAYNEGSDEKSSLVLNQVKNVLKNAQSLLDILNAGQMLTPKECSDLAVIDNNVQEIKNRVENESDDVQSPIELEPSIIEPIGSPVDGIPGEEISGEEPIVDEIPDEDDQNSSDMLPEPFPEDEVEDSGDVNVLDVETRYDDEVE